MPHTYFTYRDWEELDGYPYMGLFATYGGGGYVAELGNYLSTESEQMLFSVGLLDIHVRDIYNTCILYVIC